MSEAVKQDGETPVEEKTAAGTAKPETEQKAGKTKKSLLKKALVGLGTLLAVILAFLLVHPLWVGALARSAVNSAVPAFVGTDFRIGGLGVNGYSGKTTVDDLRLANPKGGPAELPDAFSLKSFLVDVVPLSLASSAIHVREVKVESPHVSAFCVDGKLNFAVIGENVAKKLAPAEGPVAVQAPVPEEKKAPGPAVDLDHLLVTDVRVDFGTAAALTIPRIELTTVTNVATLVVENFRVSNPADETEVTNAVAFSKLSVTLDWKSLFTKRIHVYDVTVEDPYVSAFFKDALHPVESFNFNRVFAQVIPPAPEGQKPAAEPKAEEEAAAAAPEAEEPATVVIDRVALVRTKTRILGVDIGSDGVSIAKFLPAMPGIPTVIEIRDIGKGDGKDAKAGASVETVVQDEIWPRIKEKMGGGFQKSLDMLEGVMDGKSLGDMTKSLGDGAKSLGDGAKSLGDGAVDAVKGLGDGAKAVGDGATDALKKVGNLFGK